MVAVVSVGEGLLVVGNAFKPDPSDPDRADAGPTGEQSRPTAAPTAAPPAMAPVSRNARITSSPIRYWRHSRWAPDPVARAFDAAAFERIEQAICAGEHLHRGQIRFALEERLDWAALRRGQGAHERALQVFGEQRIWDTEENTGVLIYLLTADHAVEIIADRHAHRQLPAELWPQLCRTIVDACRQGRPVDGVIAAIGCLNRAFIDVLPVLPGVDNRNELDNRPVRL